MSTFYGLIRRGVRFLIGAFFRRVEVTGLEYLPPEGGGILVSWHPNGLIDPALILASFPRQVVFGARHGLFRWPVLGQVMKAAGTVPIYRAQDAGADAGSRRAQNARSLDALAERVAGGSYSCLFPEGDSHDAPHLLRLKTGAARFYYRARELAAAGPEPVIIPVGLHYDDKNAFRSNALVSFHPPIQLSEFLAGLPQADEEPEQGWARVKQLTAEIDRVLQEVVHATESWEVHHLMHRVRKLVRAERAIRAGAALHRPGMAERTLAFARVWAGYHIRAESHPEQTAILRARIEAYDRDLRALGIEDHELDGSPRLVSPWLVLLLVLQVLLVFLVLPPVLLLGMLVNALPALGLWALATVASKREKDEATVKILFGVVAFPLAWAVAGWLAWRVHDYLETMYPVLPDQGWSVAVWVILLSILGGALSLRYLRVVRETARAVRVRLTRARARTAVAHLRVERAELYDAIVDLVGELDLPGAVTREGRVVAEDDPEAAFI